MCNRLEVVIPFNLFTIMPSIGSHTSPSPSSWDTLVKSLKVNLDEDVLCLLPLSSLLTSWDTLVTTVVNTMGNKNKLSDVVASLLNGNRV
jgi:hypothetical protein